MEKVTTKKTTVFPNKASQLTDLKKKRQKEKIKQKMWIVTTIYAFK